MRKFLAIVLCKLGRFAGRLVGKGSSLPGKLALKVCPDILSRVRLHKGGNCPSPGGSSVEPAPQSCNPVLCNNLSPVSAESYGSVSILRNHTAKKNTF